MTEQPTVFAARVITDLLAQGSSTTPYPNARSQIFGQVGFNDLAVEITLQEPMAEKPGALHLQWAEGHDARTHEIARQMLEVLTGLGCNAAYKPEHRQLAIMLTDKAIAALARLDAALTSLREATPAMQIAGGAAIGTVAQAPQPDAQPKR